MPDIATLKNKEAGFPAMLKTFQAEIERALPKHLNGDRMARIALTEFRKNPNLQKCDPRSVFAAVVVASQAGLEPGIMGHGYLIPYGEECQFVPGWRGLVDIVNRTGRATVWTGSVFEGDEFEWSLGAHPDVKHRPMGEDDPDKLEYVYAIGHVNGAAFPVIECWPMRRVLKHRDRYNRVGQRHYSYRHPEMYARKVVLLQVLKYMPVSIELAQAIELDSGANTNQHIDLKEAASGTWIPQEAETVDTSQHEEKAGHREDVKEAKATKGQVRTTYPYKDEDGVWRDKTKRAYIPEKDKWDKAENRPAVTRRGRYAGHFVRIPDVKPATEAKEDGGQEGGEYDLE